LIATAKAMDAVVVTDEKIAGPKDKSKIPYVCKARNVGCMSGKQYTLRSLESDAGKAETKTAQ